MKITFLLVLIYLLQNILLDKNSFAMQYIPKSR